MSPLHRGQAVDDRLSPLIRHPCESLCESLRER